MTKKKGKFLTFCFSLVPGMGLMYLGFMKMGVSLLGWFMLSSALSVSINLGLIFILAFVVWVYSFFLTLNINGMSDEDFYQLEDKYIVPGDIKIFEMNIIKKYRKVVAAILILLGVSLLWDNFRHLLRFIMPNETYEIIEFISYNIPQMVVGIGIIIIGFIMIKGKKKELFQKEGEQPSVDTVNQEGNNQ